MKITNGASILILAAWGIVSALLSAALPSGGYLSILYALVRSTEWYSLFISFAAEGSRNGSPSCACLGIRRRLHDCVRRPIPNIFYVVPSGPVVGLLVGVVATWSYNWQNDRLAVFDSEMEIASLELESHLKKQSRARQ
jgi:hypothetical protein